MSRIAQQRLEARKARHARIRKRLSGTTQRPRLCVRRSIKNIIAQIVDDQTGVSLLQISTSANEFKKEYGTLTKTEQGHKLGEVLAAKAKEKGITEVVFDRGGYIYHGRVKAVADGARQAGMVF